MDLKDLIIRHEGIKLKPYLDSKGKITIGVGRCLQDIGISLEEADMLLQADLIRALKAANNNFSWFSKIDRVRQDVIVSMVFNLGLGGFLEFKNMILAMEKRDFKTAAAEMLASKWKEQVGDRAIELSKMMLTGSYQKVGK